MNNTLSKVWRYLKSEGGIRHVLIIFFGFVVFTAITKSDGPTFIGKALGRWIFPKHVEDFWNITFVAIIFVAGFMIGAKKQQASSQGIKFPRKEVSGMTIFWHGVIVLWIALIVIIDFFTEGSVMQDMTYKGELFYVVIDLVLMMGVLLMCVELITKTHGLIERCKAQGIETRENFSAATISVLTFDEEIEDLSKH